jgi:hypothetical protein
MIWGFKVEPSGSRSALVKAQDLPPAICVEAQAKNARVVGEGAGL